MKKTRRLTVKKKFHQRKYNVVALPQISITGRWLEELGFNPGDHIIAKVDVNRITLKKSISK